MIRTREGKPVAVVGGPYWRLFPELGLGFYSETVAVCLLNPPPLPPGVPPARFPSEVPIGSLDADGGLEEIRAAARRAWEWATLSDCERLARIAGTADG